MLDAIAKILWWNFRRKNLIPHPDEARNLLMKQEDYVRQYSQSPKRKRQMFFEYSVGFSLEEIAMKHTVTRERVRWCVYRVYQELSCPKTTNQ